MNAVRAVQQPINPQAWADYRQALVSRYGADRALLILAGLDDRANADLAAWRKLGRRK